MPINTLNSVAYAKSFDQLILVQTQSLCYHDNSFTMYKQDEIYQALNGRRHNMRICKTVLVIRVGIYKNPLAIKELNCALNTLCIDHLLKNDIQNKRYCERNTSDVTASVLCTMACTVGKLVTNYSLYMAFLLLCISVCCN